VVNCNLQRLDGPVRGNGKIIQELESVFRGAGWNVIKVIWAREWDDILAHDVDGVLVDKMSETLDGEYQKFSVESGAYIREHFFGPIRGSRRWSPHLSDDDIQHLRRGGHDYRKVYAAYDAATKAHGPADGDPGQDRQGLDAGHRRRGPQHHAPGQEDDRAGAEGLPRSPAARHPGRKLKEAPYYHPGTDAPRSSTCSTDARHWAALCRGASVTKTLELPATPVYGEFMTGSGAQEVSTTDGVLEASA
jgi:pyruvate dehydrogenase E1 component